MSGVPCRFHRFVFKCPIKIRFGYILRIGDGPFQKYNSIFKRYRSLSSQPFSTLGAEDITQKPQPYRFQGFLTAHIRDQHASPAKLLLLPLTVLTISQHQDPLFKLMDKQP
jgi:hypothetical protein